MKEMSLQQIARACGGSYTGEDSQKNREVLGVVIDSRKVEPGYLFVAIKGERVDGHSFIPAVFAKGAACVLCERAPEHPAGPYILVDSCLNALKSLAEYYRSTLSIPVVGITGSVGKTSTKEMIAAVLGQKYRVLKTEGNFNNEIGLPLTIFRIREEHEAAVLEMGISDFGEMTRLSRMAKPNLCVITNIGLCHLENLKDRDGILKAKTEMFGEAQPGAHILLNGDDDKLVTLRESRTPTPCFFGLDPSNDLYAEQIENLGLEGTRCTFVTKAGSFQAHIPIPGRHMVYNALAGTAVGLALGLSPEEIKAGIESLTPVSGRNNLIHTEKWDILDDCYNANPVSMCASLDVLSCALGRKVAILGDMGELGEHEKLLHYNVGCHAADAGIDAVFLVGELSRETARGIEAKNPDLTFRHFDTKQELIEALPLLLSNGDSILVKASHFMEFEDLVAYLREAGTA
ncbi:MAG: UDP-N-acetylmuramoyl-tripeptide--D-alanyl-D-alanine ligase [Lachnospiraceae bacterium]|jgi:UDP-N-acetylmuramoyl-tripeptide--D-alanyl-D-alanine ligase|nr:UDP-N-acetylmuramoyl-tripeptide--D-alanyl-D-alanine ligase [Lachnospiraceae bacterium]